MDLSARLDPVLDVARATATQVDTEGSFPAQTVDALRHSGLFGLTLPPESGGLGGGPQDLVQVLGRLAALCGSAAMVYLMHLTATMAIASAPPASHPGLLKRLATDTLATLAFSEKGSRSHFWAPISRSRRENGKVTLDSAKSWVTSAGHAEVYVVSTLAPDEGIDVYVVFAGASGVEVSGPWRGLGLRGNASAPMRFQLPVADGDRIGEPGSGFALKLQAVMPWFNLGNAAVSLGLAQAALDASVTHTSGSSFQHTGEALADLPTIRAQLARAALDLETTRAYVEKAARSLAQPDESTMLHVLGVKAVANDMALRVTDVGMRVCGGAAFSEHLQVERFFRDARAGHVMAPTADVLYDFYGKAITGRELL
ncbi:acyl-CoA dehydrogenase family protein [Acrocarpospora sp. B8E8]|uniref:acyl-CoA dehydrogenase family protein n=1 Tax=Acrocarpospora sp. B8E8 TaxID=3153572 RepID=UPI00325CCDCD